MPLTSEKIDELLKEIKSITSSNANSNRENTQLLTDLRNRMIKVEMEIKQLYAFKNDCNSCKGNQKTELDKRDSRIAKLEDRLLKIEQKVWVYVGGIGLVAFLFNYIIKGITS